MNIEEFDVKKHLESKPAWYRHIWTQMESKGDELAEQDIRDIIEATRAKYQVFSLTVGALLGCLRDYKSYYQHKEDAYAMREEDKEA